MAAPTTSPVKPVADIFAEVLSELDTIENGFVELRIFKTNNALENHEVTKCKRSKGKISLHAMN